MGRRPKLTPEQEQTIREMFRKPGVSAPMLARLFRVSAGTILRIVGKPAPPV